MHKINTLAGLMVAGSLSMLAMMSPMTDGSMMMTSGSDHRESRYCDDFGHDNCSR